MKYVAQCEIVLRHQDSGGPDLVQAGEIREFDGPAPQSKVKGRVLWLPVGGEQPVKRSPGRPPKSQEPGMPAEPEKGVKAK